LIYGFLPEREPAGNRSGENYHANGYAALLELNALSIGAFRPHDVSGESEDRRLELEDPFNACYLFSDENGDRNRLDADREVPVLAPPSLYKKNISAKDGVGAPPRKQESLKTRPPRPEESPSTPPPAPPRRFFAFGLKQIVYPETEIREHLTWVL